MRLWCTSGQIDGVSRYGSIPGKGDGIGGLFLFRTIRRGLLRREDERERLLFLVAVPRLKGVGESVFLVRRGRCAGKRDAGLLRGTRCDVEEGRGDVSQEAVGVRE